MTDQHVDRTLGCTGDPVVENPAIDQLAAEGTMFGACYCPSPLCVPSRMAFLTGLEPHETGAIANNDYLPSDIPTIALVMTAAGFDCCLVGRMHFFGPDQHNGFSARPIGGIGSSWYGGAPPDIGPLTKRRGGNRGPELEHSGAGETSNRAYDLSVAEVAKRALDKLVAQRRETGRPFLPLSLCSTRIRLSSLAGKTSTGSSGGFLRPAWREAAMVGALSDSAIKNSRAAYYALVATIDEIAGRLFARVEVGKTPLRSTLPTTAKLWTNAGSGGTAPCMMKAPACH